TLMAYDLWNEPASVWPEDTIGHSKQDVCEKVKMWYDTVKAGDPHHLVTLGGKGFKDIWEYDLSILKLDFYSPHIYPSAHVEYEDSTYFEAMVNRIYGNLYWLQNNSAMPWIIGEMGFKAVDDSSFGLKYDGSLLEQESFADSVTMQTWECAGSGFSWWFYQDVGGGSGDGFGILKKNKTCGDNWPCDTILKPVWEVFDDFSPPPSGTCSEPPYYNDPYYHAFYGKDTNIVTGHVIDQDNVPIKDAWIFAQTRLYDEIVPGIPDDDTLHYYDNHYTFTNDTGYFQLLPYDYIVEAPNWHTVERIVISAPGCSRLDSARWGDSLGVPSGQTYVLDRFDFNFEDSFDSLTIIANDSIVLQAWDMVSLTNIEVQQYAYFETKARTEISVNQEFNAANGSETWIHTGNTFYPCENLYSFSKSANGIFSNDEIVDIKINKEIKLNFMPIEKAFDVRIYPNPGTGIFLIEILSNEPVTELHMFIYDQYGKEVFLRNINEKSLSLDLTHISKGVYFVQLRNMEHQIIRKLIVI
ncbi:MAG: T9SS type A sorting domain-containing protein, partial [Bacteroidota bacterium]